MPAYTVELTETPAPETRTALAEALLAFNEGMLGPPDIRPLVLLLRAPGEDGVIGGLWGRTSFGWLFVELLYVPDALRGHGLGADLLGRAEAEARRRDCIGAWLDTFSAAARGFYEKQGYRPFGEIGDYPPGHARHFLCKRFDQAGL
jgi:GNAT superfamily N-acetyltransferase